MNKKCNACDETKPLDEFHRRADSPDGHQTKCKDCRAVKKKSPRKEYNRRYRLDAQTRVCRICKFEKDVKFFNPNRKNKKGQWSVESRCIICIRAAKYDITETEYMLLLTSQGNCCAICKTSLLDKIQHTDHCHATNKVRGILCHGCNVGLGMFKDNPISLQSAIEYLSD